MDFLQRALDALVLQLREGKLLREHGLSILFYAAASAAALVLFTGFPLDDFHDRAIGQAMLENFSIAARTALFAKAILLFLAVAAAGAWALPALERRIGTEATRALNVSSLIGLCLIWLSIWKVWVPIAMALLGVGQVLIVVLAFLDRKRSGEVGHRGHYTAWLGANAFALLFPLHDFALESMPRHDAFVPLFVLAAGLVLDFLRRIARFGRTGERAALASDRFVFALTPLATLPAITVMRNEVYLLLNQWGVLAITPDVVEVALLTLVLAWCVARAWRGPARIEAGPRLDVERLLGRFSFPWLLGGFCALGRFYYLIEPSPDFLEPANAGLMIQQLFEFGRVPFFETFNAHGLADSFFGLVYSAVVGFKDETWQMFDFLFNVAMVLVAFQVLRRMLGSALAACFLLVMTPLMDPLFPGYCTLSAFAVFVVEWALKKRDTGAWAVFFLFLVFGLLWRLDMGFAVAMASIGTLVAVVVVVPDHRLAIGAIARGAILAGAGCALVFLAVCAWRGIAPIPLILDLKAIVGSNQAFGGIRFANARTEIVMMHVYAIPLAVTLLALWMALRLRGRIDVKDRKFSVFVAVAFFTAYYYANYPRGLVRHTFLEVGNTMTSSFAFLVISAAPYWILPETRRLSAFAGFFAISTLLAFNVSLENPDRRDVPLRPNPIERTISSLRYYYRVPYSPQPIDRTPVSGGYMVTHLERILPFLEGELEEDETFLDLSNSPMLYFLAHRVSPHYMNHLLLVYGDYLQKRVLEQLNAYKVPLVLLRVHPGLARAANVSDFSVLDDVPFAIRHYRLHEWVYENYEPFAVVQRWQVWIQKDRLLKDPPLATDERRIFAWDASGVHFEAPADGDPLSVRIGAGAAATQGPRALLSPDKAYFLRIAGRSDAGARLAISWSTRDLLAGQASDARSVAWAPGPAERYFFLPGEHGFRSLEEFTVTWEAGFEPRKLELVECDSNECRSLNRRVHANEVFELGDIPYLWGSFDEDRAREPEVLRELSGVVLAPGAPEVFVDNVTDGAFVHGIRADRAGFRQGNDAVNPPAPVQIGDRLAFEGSGTRTVVDVQGQDVLLDGTPLDPARDGAPHRVRFALKTPAGQREIPGLIREGTSSLFHFEPLPSNDGGTYLLLRAKAGESKSSRLVVDFGQGAEIAGRFVMRLQADGKPHDYALRLSTQYNWFHRACDWINLSPEGGPVLVERARLTKGD